ncbi:hypothetical protein D9M72_354440 [compost metagenome]
MRSRSQVAALPSGRCLCQTSSIATGQSCCWNASGGVTRRAAAGELATTCHGTKARPNPRLTSSTITHWLSTHHTSAATRRRIFSSLSERVATISWR